MKSLSNRFHRKVWQIQLALEKFFQSVFLKVEEKIDISVDSKFDLSPTCPIGSLYFNKDIVIKRGPIKVLIYSEYRGGNMYKHFVTVYLFRMKLIETFWRTNKGNDDSFHTTGYSK